MRLYHFSDSHQKHRKIKVPKNIDIAIFSGDAGTYRDPYMSDPIIRDFMDWYYGLDIEHKIYVAGNHDCPLESRLITKKDFTDRGIIYLENEEVIIGNIAIWGSPFTPTFGNWSFMKSRNKIHKVWDMIPKGLDFLVTHGPPKSILDLVRFPPYTKQVGCGNLLNQIIEKEPKYHLFGHVHDQKGIKNSGILKSTTIKTIFSNASCVKDGPGLPLVSHGNIIEYNKMI